MNRRRSSTAATLLAMLIVFVFAADAFGASITWSDPLVLNAERGADLSDAAFAGDYAAIAWSHTVGDASEIRVKSSLDGGRTFSPTGVIQDAREAAVALCADEIDLTFTRKLRTGRIDVYLAVGRVGNNEFIVRRVAGGDGARSRVDVACTDGRVFVSWYERQGGPSRRWVSNALLATHEFGQPMDLGLDTNNYDGYYVPRGFRIAASSDTAYAVFAADNGDLRLKRWSFGSAPGYLLHGHTVQRVAPGTTRCPSEDPVIAADRDTVLIAWDRNSGLFARVSSNSGVSWDPVRVVSEVGCPAIVEGGESAAGVAVHGSSMLLTGAGCGFTSCSEFMYRSNDKFAHSEWTGQAWEEQEHVVGFIRAAGAFRIADAYSNSRWMRFRHST